MNARSGWGTNEYMAEKGQLPLCHCTMLNANSVYKQRQKPFFSRGPRILRLQNVWLLDRTQWDGGTPGV